MHFWLEEQNLCRYNVITIKENFVIIFNHLSALYIRQTMFAIVRTIHIWQDFERSNCYIDHLSGLFIIDYQWSNTPWHNRISSCISMISYQRFSYWLENRFHCWSLHINYFRSHVVDVQIMISHWNLLHYNLTRESWLIVVIENVFDWI